MGNSIYKPYISWVFMGKLSPRIIFQNTDIRFPTPKFRPFSEDEFEGTISKEYEKNSKLLDVGSSVVGCWELVFLVQLVGG